MGMPSGVLRRIEELREDGDEEVGRAAAVTLARMQRGRDRGDNETQA